MGSHKTAISRKGPSAPLKFILSNEEVKDPILDYGCGKGADSKHLTSLNYNVTSYDPYWNPKNMDDKSNLYNTIICNYVLNVIDESEEKEVLLDIKRLLSKNGTAYLSVRRDLKKEGKTTKGLQRNVFLDMPSICDKKGYFCIYKVKKEDI